MAEANKMKIQSLSMALQQLQSYGYTDIHQTFTQLLKASPAQCKWMFPSTLDLEEWMAIVNGKWKAEALLAFIYKRWQLRLYSKHIYMNNGDAADVKTRALVSAKNSKMCLEYIEILEGIYCFIHALCMILQSISYISLMRSSVARTVESLSKYFSCICINSVLQSIIFYIISCYLYDEAKTYSSTDGQALPEGAPEENDHTRGKCTAIVRRVQSAHKCKNAKNHRSGQRKRKESHATEFSDGKQDLKERGESVRNWESTASIQRYHNYQLTKSGVEPEFAPGDRVHGKTISSKKPTSLIWLDDKLINFIGGSHTETSLMDVKRFLRNYIQIHSLATRWISRWKRNMCQCDDALKRLFGEEWISFEGPCFEKLLVKKRLCRPFAFWPYGSW